MSERVAGVSVVALYDIEKYDDYLIISTDQIGKSHRSLEGLSCDFIEALHVFFEEFSQAIILLDWDYIAIEFWFDAGHFYLFPEKQLNELPTEYDPFPADRLDPYLVLCLTSYLKKYDIFIEHDYDKLSETEFLDWHLENCKEVFDSVSLALSDSQLTRFVLDSLNRKNIVFRFFGTSRETTYGEKTIASSG